MRGLARPSDALNRHQDHSDDGRSNLVLRVIYICSTLDIVKSVKQCTIPGIFIIQN